MNTDEKYLSSEQFLSFEQVNSSLFKDSFDQVDRFHILHLKWQNNFLENFAELQHENDMLLFESILRDLGQELLSPSEREIYKFNHFDIGYNFVLTLL